jgi:hypothetical protein
MSISSANAPAAAGKTRYVETLTSGTSWTVPAGVTYVNATLVGGGQGGAGGYGASNQGWNERGVHGLGGQIITTNVTTTPGASIAYAIGAGGAGGASGDFGSTGGTTTFTGATSATGGGSTNNGINASNGGRAGGVNGSGATGGAGQIILEYWK